MTIEEQEKLIDFFKTMPNTQELWYLDYVNGMWETNFILIKVMALFKSTRRNDDLECFILENGHQIWLIDEDIDNFKIVTNFVN
jgi:dihydroorotase